MLHLCSSFILKNISSSFPLELVKTLGKKKKKEKVSNVAKKIVVSQVCWKLLCADLLCVVSRRGFSTRQGEKPFQPYWVNYLGDEQGK